MGGQLALTPQQRQTLLAYQRDELTEHHIYTRLARRSGTRRTGLSWSASRRTNCAIPASGPVSPDRRSAPTGSGWASTSWSGGFWASPLRSNLWSGREGAQDNYARMEGVVPDVGAVAQDEKAHEEALLAMLDEERLRYTGSIVLGLNDALVELTGTLAGLTLALQNTSLVAMTGAITGIAAALSMAASEYLSTKAEGDGRDPLRASLYTGVAYLFTVLALILPYLVLRNLYLCLAATLAVAVLIIAFFTYYISVARDLPFRRRFLEMAGLSLAVAVVSFGIGILMRTVFGVEV